MKALDNPPDVRKGSIVRASGASGPMDGKVPPKPQKDASKKVEEKETKKSTDGADVKPSSDPKEGEQKQKPTSNMKVSR